MTIKYCKCGHCDIVRKKLKHLKQYTKYMKFSNMINKLEEAGVIRNMNWKWNFNISKFEVIKRQESKSRRDKCLGCEKELDGSEPFRLFRGYAYHPNCYKNVKYKNKSMDNSIIEVRKFK